MNSYTGIMSGVHYRRIVIAMLAVAIRGTTGQLNSVTACTFTKPGTAYRGTVSQTPSGRTCQRWDSQTPHSHSYYTNSMFPDGSVSGAQNYCRNPDDQEDGGPWCFTTDPTKRYEYCDIPKCECLTTSSGQGYQGNIAVTVNGRTCQRWDQQTPHAHNYINADTFPDESLVAANNFCRNPDPNWQGGAWCYTTDTNVRWEPCNIPMCECKSSVDGFTYQGQKSSTTSGSTCQRWDTQVPHQHPYTSGSMYPDNSVAAASNYCRNPDNSRTVGPWCYTANPTPEWETCDVPLCEFHLRPPSTTQGPSTTPFTGTTPYIPVVTQQPGVAKQECKFTKRGSSYEGTMSTTVSGRSCQRWDTQAPHAHSYTDPTKYPDDSIAAANNYCRNPDEIEPLGPWCYTTDPAKRWEYCNIPMCDCRTTRAGLDYMGRRSTTVSGKTCQRWDSNVPHSHSYLNDTMFPDGSRSDAVNFCRNPDVLEPNGPWCFTTDAATRWEYCDVPFCECSTTKDGMNYHGTISQTETGLTCQRWDTQSPHQHSYTNPSFYPDTLIADASNFCRNPDDVETGGPWCFTTDSNTRWQYCDVPYCEYHDVMAVSASTTAPTAPTVTPVPAPDCKFTKRGTAYMGKTTQTKTGKTCQRWDTQSPHSHSYYNDAMFPDNTQADAGNYCRNPDALEDGGPWCFTTDPNTRWEYCDIPDCDCRTTSGGHDYMGTKAVTKNNKVCQRWDAFTPHFHTYTQPMDYPDASITDAQNYCRNPDEGYFSGPWCYTMDPNIRWEDCDIGFCECKNDVAGLDYRGMTATTVSGKSCQRWDSQTPHQHTYTDNSMYPDGSASAANNFCRNPDDNEPAGPWCYTTDPSTRWEYCTVPLCEYHIRTTTTVTQPSTTPFTGRTPPPAAATQTPGTTKQDCRFTVKGTSFRGTTSTTLGNKNCQRWDSQTPHAHTYTNPSMYPDSSISEAANYCRNPDELEPLGPWCYTTDPNIRWQYCDIPLCDCRQTKAGTEYMGQVATTMSGKSCQRWDTQSPHGHSYLDPNTFPEGSLTLANNYCRNPDVLEPNGPWCYTTDPNVRWEYCDIPYCECKTKDDGLQYRGSIGTTVSGKSCQRWDSSSPHSHTYYDNSLFPEGSVAAAAAFCRNPDDLEPNGPWCFTTDPQTRWEYCDVSLCEYHDPLLTSQPTVEPPGPDCLFTKRGTGYMGTRSTTRTGKRCQPWTAQTPHAHSYYQADAFPDSDVASANNYCRNPDALEEGGPWCFTMDASVRWEYCDIPMCDCRDTRGGHEYIGTTSVSALGKTCQRWTDQTPHAHSYNDPNMYPDDTIEDAMNFCRNPDILWAEGPWCYTMSSVRWESCDIPFCECKLTADGLNYMGKKAMTVTGKSCQRWDSQTPHQHTYTDNSMYPDGSASAANNYCRNPDDNEPGGPWCYTTDPNVRWEYCTVPLCEYHMWTTTSPSGPSTTPFTGPTPPAPVVTQSPGTSKQNCKFTVRGTSFRGTVATTVTGKTCQRWDSQAPHSHTYTDPSLYPDPSLADANNYCRNPDQHEPLGPWCYTTDANTRWEYCDIPLCDCRQSTAGLDYLGHVSKTVTGKTCQRWDSQTPHKHSYTDISLYPDSSLALAGSYCRNPDDNEPDGPWCYTTDPNVRWEYCDIPYCECKRLDSGVQYQGTVAQTNMGVACQRWDAQSPHAHSYVDDTAYPDGSRTAAKNYCRNPDYLEPNGPWCYTMNPGIRWQYCDIPPCELHNAPNTPMPTPPTHQQNCRFTTPGTSYMGTLSMTPSGRKCQRWDSQTPHAHTYLSNDMFPDGSLSAAENYCRNPDDQEPLGPWCYTTDPNKRWEYCDVPYCECTISRGGHEYQGKISVTYSGKKCQSWTSQSPHAHSYNSPSLYPDDTIAEALNDCRNPDPLWKDGTWCYTMNPSVRWESCSIPMCDCKLRKEGLDYLGTVSVTVSGRSCQRWDLQTPHQHMYTDPSMYADGDLSAAHNYCRNPDLNEPNGPWCYTTDPGKRWEYCAIPLCEYHLQPTTTPTVPSTTPFTGTTPGGGVATELPGLPQQECLFTQQGTAYRGTRARTVSGKACQRWDSQTPHAHSYTKDSMYPDKTIREAQNHCRNPDELEPLGPWCYTTDPNTRWEYCDIPRCDCRKTKAGPDYIGLKSNTIRGKSCQRWDMQSPHKHLFTDPYAFPDRNISKAENHCRNPGTSELEGPWCYTTDPLVRQDFCDIEYCECSYDAQGLLYQGKIEVTERGVKCQRWDSQVPHAHTYLDDSMFPEASVTLANNYCRNPDDQEPGGPWCYTTDPNIRWQYCDVPKCEYHNVTILTTTPVITTTVAPGTGCRVNKHGRTYAGLLNTSASGRTCQRWDSQSPHKHTYLDDSAFPEGSATAAVNYCRNPDSQEPEGPWCYTTDPDVRWEYCNIPFCECKETKAGEEYGGHKAETVSGKPCQRWVDQTPHNHKHFDECMFPDMTLKDAENYCRNPDEERPNGPWCYTTDPKTRWEYCDVSLCGSGSVNPPEKLTGQTNGGAIAGIVLGVLLAILIIMAVIYYLRQNQKSGEDSQNLTDKIKDIPGRLRSIPETFRQRFRNEAGNSFENPAYSAGADKIEFGPPPDIQPAGGAGDTSPEQSGLPETSYA